MKYIRYFFFSLLGIILGGIYGSIKAITKVLMALVHSIVLHIVSIIPVLMSVYIFYMNAGYNPILAIIACILHLPFLLIYAAISLGVPAVVSIFLGFCMPIVYIIMGALNPGELFGFIAEDCADIPRSAYFYFIEYNIEIIKEFMRIVADRTDQEIPFYDGLSLMCYINFVYIGCIYCLCIFMCGISFMLMNDGFPFMQRWTQRWNDEYTNDYYTSEEQDVLHDFSLLPHELEKIKHILLSDNEIKRYKSSNIAAVQTLAQQYETLKEELITNGTCPITLEHPTNADTILVTKHDGQNQIVSRLYSTNAFTNYIQTRITNDYPLLEPITNELLVPENQEEYCYTIHPLYAEEENTVYCAKLKNIAKEIQTTLEYAQRKDLAYTAATQRKQSSESSEVQSGSAVNTTAGAQRMPVKQQSELSKLAANAACRRLSLFQATIRADETSLDAVINLDVGDTATC